MNSIESVEFNEFQEILELHRCHVIACHSMKYHGCHESHDSLWIPSGIPRKTQDDPELTQTDPNAPEATPKTVPGRVPVPSWERPLGVLCPGNAQEPHQRIQSSILKSTDFHFEVFSRPCLMNVGDVSGSSHVEVYQVSAWDFRTTLGVEQQCNGLNNSMSESIREDFMLRIFF